MTVRAAGATAPARFSTALHNLYWEKRWAGWLGDAIDYSTPAHEGSDP